MRSRRFGANRRRLAILVAPSLLAIPNYLHAQVLFTAAPAGDWNVGANWSTQGVPGASQNAQINANNTATIGIANATTKILTIGNSASGTLSVLSGGTFTLSTQATSTNINIGNGGAGTLIVNGGFVVNNVSVNVGATSSSGAGTILMQSGTLSLVAPSNGSATYLGFGVATGAGTLIQTGGLISLPSTGTFGLGRGATGYYDMEGGTFNIGGVFQMASGSGMMPTGVGTFIQNGGTITANQVTFAANGQATCTMNGGTLIATTGMNLANNAACVATVVQGSNQYVGAGSLDIGVGSSTGSAATATYFLNTGTLAVGTTMIVGGSSSTLANGTYSQNGGFLSVGSALFVGDGTGSTGEMDITGTGSIQVGPAGTVFVGTSGSGTFNLCSTAAGVATLTAGTIQVGSVSSSGTTEVDSQFLMGSTTILAPIPDGVLPVNSPTVTVGTIDFGQTDSSAATTRLFSIGSGTLTAGLVDLTSYNAGGNAQNQATFQQLGGTANIGSMTFAGGIYQVGNATAAPIVVNSAALTVNPAGQGVLLSGVTATYAGGGTIATTGSVTLNGALVNNGAVLDVGAATNGTGTVSFRGAQTNAVGSGITVNSGQVNLQTDGGPNLTFTVSNAGKAVIGGGTFANVTENLGTLSILGGGVARLFSNGPAATPTILLHAGTLSIHGDAVPTGTLDLSADDAIVDNGDFPTIQAQVKSGYAGGTWQGPGIRSSNASQSPSVTGVGYATASELGITTFDGVSGLSPSAVLLKYTLLGDANLDGTVNALDFNALATNFGIPDSDWAEGDFNYSADGTVDSNDFALLAANYNKTVGSLSAAIPDGAQPAVGLGSVVPEPVSVALMMVCGLGMMTRRRRI